MAAPKTTRLASTVVGPQPTVAGDAPADTWLASEQAHSVSPDKKTAALAGHLTVNAVVEGAGLTFPSQVARVGNRYDGFPVSAGVSGSFTDADGNTVSVFIPAAAAPEKHHA